MLFPIDQVSSIVLDRFWPVGSVHLRADALDPSLLFGGTWQVIGQGQVLVGQDTNQTEFAAIGQTGGAKTVTLVTAQLPNHSHTVTDPGHTHTQQAHSHATLQVQGGTTAATTGQHVMTSTAVGGSSRATVSPEAANAATAVNNTATTGISVNGSGSDQPHPNLPPYLVVRFWQRTG